MFDRIIKISKLLIYFSILFLLTDLSIDVLFEYDFPFATEILEIIHPFTHIALFLLLILYIYMIKELKKEKDFMMSKKDQTIAFIKGDFSASVGSFFSAKGLTSAEADVAYLIIKGLSYKEIADQRGSSVNTIRNQSYNIFKKLDCSGRSEFVAIVFDDIL